MILGYTHGEIAVTVFIFFLIYGAGFLVRAGRAVGRLMGPAGAPADKAPERDER